MTAAVLILLAPLGAWALETACQSVRGRQPSETVRDLERLRADEEWQGLHLVPDAAFRTEAVDAIEAERNFSSERLTDFEDGYSEGHDNAARIVRDLNT